MRRSVLALWLVSLAVVSSARDRAPVRPPALPAAPAALPGAAALPRFALFGWVSPPVGETTRERYAELADAGMNTTVLAWEDPGSVAQNLLRLEYSEASGLRNLLLDQRFDHVAGEDERSLATLDSIVATYRDAPAFLGYYLGDEPSEARFPELALWFRLLRARDPSHPAWNNLRGRGAFTTNEQFLDHLRGYVREVAPTVLCTDHYDHLVGRDRGQFIQNVAGTALVARESGLPFWGIVLVTPHSGYRDPDDALVRWQVAQWLAYGTRGIGYFTYWTPAPDSGIGWGSGMIEWGSGARSPHYEQVRRLNSRLLPLGEALADLAWLSTEHAGGVPLGGTAFQPDSLVTAVEGRVSLGLFADAAGEPYVFVANRDSAAAQAVAIEVAGARRVERFGDSGGWSAWATRPTPGGQRLTLTLPAGDFTLFRLSGGCTGVASGGCDATLDALPNPASGRVRFGARGVRGGSTLVLCDVTGRRVWGRVLSGEAPLVEWDGRDDAGRRVRPGLYWARLTDARGSVVRRVAWLGAR